MLCGLDEMARFLRQHDSYAVITHFKPDGDAYGSALGLVHLLRGMGKRAFPVCDDPVEPNYQFLPGWEEFTNAEIGEDLGMSSERVRQLKNGAIKKMQQAAAAEHLSF